MIGAQAETGGAARYLCRQGGDIAERCPDKKQHLLDLTTSNQVKDSVNPPKLPQLCLRW